MTKKQYAVAFIAIILTQIIFGICIMMDNRQNDDARLKIMTENIEYAKAMIERNNQISKLLDAKINGYSDTLKIIENNTTNHEKYFTNLHYILSADSSQSAAKYREDVEAFDSLYREGFFSYRITK